MDKVTIGGIVNKSANNGYCFEIKADNLELLQNVKKHIRIAIWTQGIETEEEQRYHDS